MIRRTLHGTKSRDLSPDSPRVALAMGKESLTQPEPAILRQQNGLAEVADRLQIIATCLEGRLELRSLLTHRHAGRCAHYAIFIQGQHDKAPRAAQVALQVVTLVIEAAVVEVGILSKDGDAQCAQRVDVRCQGSAGEWQKSEGHGPQKGRGSHIPQPPACTSAPSRYGQATPHDQDLRNPR